VISAVENVIAIQSLVGRVDYVIGNPPWVRIHNISKNVREYLRNKYSFVAKNSGYNPGFEKTSTPFREQIDYSLAFVERGLEFLKEGGVLAYVITSKITKATYAGKLREELLKNTTIIKLVDYSLHPVQLFQGATNYPLIIAVKKAPPPRDHRVKVVIYNTGEARREFEVEQKELPLYAGTRYPNRERSPWILAPQSIVTAVKKIVRSNLRLGDKYEITRGVETSLNKVYIGEVVKHDNGIVLLELEGGKHVEVEEHLVHPVVRGEDVDPFTYTFNQWIIFPHNPETLEPLWDPEQKEVLNELGVFGRKVDVKASGNTLYYYVKDENCKKTVESAVKSLRELGLQEVKPCIRKHCFSGRGLLVEISIEDDTCVYSIRGLRIPDAPKATQHFTNHLEELVKRKGYRASLPPWAVFRASRDKFEEYRIAWQEMARRLEAVHLPARININGWGEKLLVPIQKVYFIVERDRDKAFWLLLYLGSDLASSLVKLWAWPIRGGYYEHISYSMGLLPVPRSVELPEFVREYIERYGGGDLNELARRIMNAHREKLEYVFARALGITEDEYREIVEFGKWLNETTQPIQTGEPIEEEEETGEEEE